MVVRFIVFLISATLICRSTDITKCFRESLGIRDNESQLYLKPFVVLEKSTFSSLVLLDKTVILILTRRLLFSSLIQDGIVVQPCHHRDSAFPKRDVTISVAF